MRTLPARVLSTSGAAAAEMADGYRAGKAPARVQTLASHRSPPLSQVLRDMNKNSNNVIARSLFLTLGAQRAGQQTVQNARAEVRRELTAAGLDDEALNLENGSGLSRRERATARMLGEMLSVAWKSPFRQAFIDSLPIGGVDSTLKPFCRAQSKRPLLSENRQTSIMCARWQVTGCLPTAAKVTRWRWW